MMKLLQVKEMMKLVEEAKIVNAFEMAIAEVDAFLLRQMMMMMMSRKLLAYSNQLVVMILSSALMLVTLLR